MKEWSIRYGIKNLFKVPDSLAIAEGPHQDSHDRRRTDITKESTSLKMQDFLMDVNDLDLVNENPAQHSPSSDYEVASRSAINRLPAELLLAILEWLGRTDMRTLLLSQRVCRHWQELITNHSILQELLYFRSSSSKASEDSSETYVGAINPLLYSIFGPIFITKNGPGTRDIFEFRWRLPFFQAGALSVQLAHPNASWRRMVVFRRPVARLLVVHSLCSRGGSDAWVSQIDLKQYGCNMTMDLYWTLCLSSKVMGLNPSSFWRLLPAATAEQRKTFLSYPHNDPSLPMAWLNPKISTWLQEKDAAILLTKAPILFRRPSPPTEAELGWLPPARETMPQIEWITPKPPWTGDWD